MGIPPLTVGLGPGRQSPPVHRLYKSPRWSRVSWPCSCSPCCSWPWPLPRPRGRQRRRAVLACPVRNKKYRTTGPKKSLMPVSISARAWVTWPRGWARLQSASPLGSSWWLSSLCSAAVGSPFVSPSGVAAARPKLEMEAMCKLHHLLNDRLLYTW